MKNHLSEGADWIEAVRNTSEQERARARALLVKLKVFDIIEILGLNQ